MTEKRFDLIGWIGTAVLFLVPTLVVAEGEWHLISGAATMAGGAEVAAAWAQALLSAAAIFFAFALQDRERRAAAKDAADRHTEVVNMLAANAVGFFSSLQSRARNNTWSCDLLDHYEARLEADMASFSSVDVTQLPNRLVVAQYFILRATLVSAQTQLASARKRLASRRPAIPTLFDDNLALAQQVIERLRPYTAERR